MLNRIFGGARGSSTGRRGSTSGGGAQQRVVIEADRERNLAAFLDALDAAAADLPAVTIAVAKKPGTNAVDMVTDLDQIGRTLFAASCMAQVGFVFLITPILVVMPLSFNAENFFTFTPEMLRFDPEGYSLRHYRDFFTSS